MTVQLPGEAELFALAGRDGMRSSVMTLNGTDLVAGDKGELPELTGVKVSGEVLAGQAAYVNNSSGKITASSSSATAITGGVFKSNAADGRLAQLEIA